MAINHLCENMNKRMISMAQLLTPLWLWRSIMHKTGFCHLKLNKKYVNNLFLTDVLLLEHFVQDLNKLS